MVTHCGDPDFLLALDELRALHLSKGSDYADLSDPLRNYAMSAADCGLEAWQAALLRLSEKYHRITNLLRKGAGPQHESIEDTLMDMAALALIVRSLRRRRQAERLQLSTPVCNSTRPPWWCSACITATWCDHHRQCLANSVPAQADATGEP